MFLLEPCNGKYTFEYIFCILAPIKKKLPQDIHSAQHNRRLLHPRADCGKSSITILSFFMRHNLIGPKKKRRTIIFFPSLALLAKLITIRPMMVVFNSCRDNGCSELWWSFHLCGNPHSLTEYGLGNLICLQKLLCFGPSKGSF